MCVCVLLVNLGMQHVCVLLVNLGMQHVLGPQTPSHDQHIFINVSIKVTHWLQQVPAMCEFWPRGPRSEVINFYCYIYQALLLNNK